MKWNSWGDLYETFVQCVNYAQMFHIHQTQPLYRSPTLGYIFSRNYIQVWKPTAFILERRKKKTWTVLRFELQSIETKVQPNVRQLLTLSNPPHFNLLWLQFFILCQKIKTKSLIWTSNERIKLNTQCPWLILS